jgi:hypothetical protein
MIVAGDHCRLPMMAARFAGLLLLSSIWIEL